MPFEWDPDKANSNSRKHRVTFEVATLVFDDANASEVLDEDVTDEERIKRIGFVDGRVLVVVYTERADRIRSSQPAKRLVMRKKPISAALRKMPTHEPNGTAAPAMDWAALDALTEAEVEAAAKSDPDAQPLTSSELKRLRRVAFARLVRQKLGLSQAEFATAFQIPVGTLRDWEQHRTEPDQAASAYLRVIAADPEAVRRALAAETG